MCVRVRSASRLKEGSESGGRPPSLGATTLLHQACIDIAARDGLQFPDRPRFMGYAARVMRGVIIDHARSRHALKRGGRIEITAIDTTVADSPADEGELLRIIEGLDEPAQIDASLLT